MVFLYRLHEKRLRRKCNRDWKVSIDSRNAFCKHRYGVWIRIPNAIEIVGESKNEYRERAMFGEKFVEKRK